MVILIDPGLGRLVGKGQAQVLDPAQKFHQTAFQLSPEDLLLAVLVGGIRQRRFVFDGQPL
jgi:hypothetical protein